MFNTIYIGKQSEEKLYREFWAKIKKKKGVSLMLIYRKTPIRNIVARYIRKERAIFPYIYKENTII